MSRATKKAIVGAAEQLKDYALSNDDINAILEPDTRIWVYPDFARMSSIDEAFDELGRCIFLFLTESKSSGHWCCMYKNGDTIRYFDPYGLAPEAGREWLSQQQLEALGQGEPFLYNLLKDSGYKVYYNTCPYQKERADVATCGRWCVTRLVLKDLTDKKDHDTVMKSGVAPDTFSTIFTAEILGK